MSRLTIITKDKAQVTMESLYQDLERRIVASPPGLCTIDLTRSFIKMCLAQSCGKCVPCRVGLRQLARLFDDVLDGNATEETLDVIRLTAEGIYYSADCAIGYEAAKLVLKCIDGCEDDFRSHIERGFCSCNSNQPVACVKSCPAGVDIPGYIALVHEGRYADAVRLIRRDNPMPTTCAYICEHPCENRCKRTLIDAPVNIRGLKKMAVDNAGDVPVPACNEPTGKKVAIIGGGPGGLSAAYYLALMGHKVTIFEQRKQLGGMLRYGIPNYRLPRKKLDVEINAILSTGIEVKKNISVGTDITLEDINKEYNAVYISIGAHADKKIGIDGEDATTGVTSAVEMLRAIGDDEMPDYTGKRVVVIGGGNVAMDVARSSVRLGAEKVSIVYRRRVADMTALPAEIEGAIAEGIEVQTLKAPASLDIDENHHIKGMYVTPQMISEIKGGRASVKATGEPDQYIPCDILVVAIGQNIETEHFAEAGIPVERGKIVTTAGGDFLDMPGVFAGGDCASGPATVIKAIAAAKVVAANIDEYLGYHHEISCDVEIPKASLHDRVPCGRAELTEREACERVCDFEGVENCMTEKEAKQEACRCLRCDHFGYGIFKGGREKLW